MKKKYKIFTADNFHMYDEEEGTDLSGEYDTQVEAVEAAKSIVDKSLRWERSQSRDPFDSDELYDRYQDFGDSPVIRPDTDPPFSAWDYAKLRCPEICKEILPLKK